MTTELVLHATLYFEVPEGTKPENYINYLNSLSKDDILKQVTAMNDGLYFEVQEVE